MFNADVLYGNGIRVSATTLNNVIEHVLKIFQEEKLPLTVINTILTEVENELEARAKL